MFSIRKRRSPAKPTQPPKDVQWVISLLEATPAKQIGIVYAPDEATAMARAIEQFRIPENQQGRLFARSSCETKA